MHNLSHEINICLNSPELAHFIAYYFAILHNISKNLNLLRNSNRKIWSFEYMLAIACPYFYFFD